MTVLDRHGANRTISKKREVSRVIRQKHQNNKSA